MDEEKPCMSFDRQVEELFDTPPTGTATAIQPTPSSPKKFSRIRDFVQKVNEECLATIFEAEERHKAEVMHFRDVLDAHAEENAILKEEVSVLQHKITELTCKEQEQLSYLKQGSERILKLEDLHQAEKDKNAALEEENNTLRNKEREHLDFVEQVQSKEQKHLEFVKQASEKLKKMEASEESLKNKNAALHVKLTALLTKEKEHANYEKQSSKKINEMEANEEGLKKEIEALKEKIDRLTTKEQEYIELVKQASEKIRKLEALEQSHKNYVEKAGQKLSHLTAEERKNQEKAHEKIKMMEAREEKVVALAKKAALKIKDLEARNKITKASLKKATENIDKLKEMLLAKHDDLEAVQEEASVQYDALVEELVQTSKQRASLQASLVETTDQYLEEHDLRKAHQKKISSLQKMIEEYDDGSEIDWCFSKEEDQLSPLSIYRESCVRTKEDFEELRKRVHDRIPSSIKQSYHQVGFFKTNDYYFPVLALGPFDVPPGALRKKWLDKATTLLGVYYYGQEDETLAYDMIPAESFIPYYEGFSQGFHIVPASISEKEEEGQELAPIEYIFKNGINKINMEAKSEPWARSHTLKDFKESFELEESFRRAAVDPEALRTGFKETIKSAMNANVSIAKRENLVAELEKIQGSVTSPKRKAATKKGPGLSIDVQHSKSCGDDTVDSISTPASNWDGESTTTMSSLEEQMFSFMQELASTKSTATPKKGPILPKCSEEVEGADSRDIYGDVRDDVEERDQIPSFKERLQMFGGNTKNLKNMWQQKAAGNNASSDNTPKQGNKISEVQDTVAEVSTNSAAKPTRSVTIPKNLLKKIEAGEELTDQEKEILQGIQQLDFCSITSSASSGESVEVQHNDIILDAEQATEVTITTAE